MKTDVYYKFFQKNLIFRRKKMLENPSFVFSDTKKCNDISDQTYAKTSLTFLQNGCTMVYSTD